MKPFLGLFEPQHPEFARWWRNAEMSRHVDEGPQMFIGNQHDHSCFPSCVNDEPGRWTAALHADVGSSVRQNEYNAALAGLPFRRIEPDPYPAKLGTDLGNEIEWQP